jgi:hypothetical protein
MNSMSSTDQTNEDSDDRALRQAHWADHRKLLVAADQKSQEDFDKTVLALSGGALGISFAFLKDVIGTEPIHFSMLLVSAWSVWGLSMLCVLTSYFCSHMAIRRMITQIDEDTFHTQKKGGAWRDVTATLNVLGAVFFVGGVLSITIFAAKNLHEKGESTNAKLKATVPAAQPAASAGTTPANAASKPTSAK